VQRAADSGARRLRRKIALLEAGSYAHNAGALLLHAHDLSAADKLPVSSRVGHGESHFDFGVKLRNKFAVKENAVEIEIADKSDVFRTFSRAHGDGAATIEGNPHATAAAFGVLPFTGLRLHCSRQ